MKYLDHCGLVYHERQRDNARWIGPPEQRLDGEPEVKVLPLSRVDPKPNMEVRAHGETYLIPFDFNGDWFSVRSPKGKKLI